MTITTNWPEGYAPVRTLGGDQRAVSTASPKCPLWCTNHTHPCAAEQDLCDASGGHRWHSGRIGSVVLPSRVDAYYDEEIGVELYRYEGDGGQVDQQSVLITYSCEMDEIGHVTLSVDEARQLVALTRSDWHPRAGTRPQARFADGRDNNILVEYRAGVLSFEFVMTVEGRTVCLSLHRSQLQSLGDLVACACVLAEVTQ